MTETPVKAWICPVCGYIHYGDEPPDECPVCGTEKELFEPYSEPSHEKEEAVEVINPPTQNGGKVVIVGAGIAGVTAAESLRKADPQVEITLISNESGLPYYRLNLTRYLIGEVNAAQLELHPGEWYVDNHITLMMNTELSAIDLAKKELTLKDGQRLGFGRLILTVGSHPFVPPIPGAQKKNVTTLRTRHNADFILEACKKIKNCVCIGGGILGLEAAGAVARQGVNVTVLENQAWLLPRQLNERASHLFEQRIRSLGISVCVRAQTQELLGGDSVEAVQLADGTRLPADLVIISAGVRSNVELARQAGLETKNGILVDDNMHTSHPDVFAAGDVSEHKGVLYGIWGPSQSQGIVAGMNAAGQSAVFRAIPRSNTLKALGIPLYNIGRIASQEAGDRLIEAEIDSNYYAFIFQETKMVGSILLGDTSLSSKVKKVVEDQLDWSAVLQMDTQIQAILAFLHDVP